MNRKILKTIMTFIYIFFIISMLSNTFAAITSSFSGTLPSDSTSTNAIKKILNIVLNVVKTAGAFIAVGILIVIACKYIMASAGDRADIKKYAINYIIGAVILFAASGIASIIQNIMNDAFPAVT